MKKASPATTMLGPAGVSHLSDPSRPSQTLPAPNTDAITAMTSGLPENRLAVAAGTISKASCPNANVHCLLATLMI